MKTKKQPLLAQYSDLILLLNRLSPSNRAKLLSQLRSQEVNCLSEIISNFLKGHLTTDPRIIKRLKKYRSDLKILALRKTPLYVKKSLLAAKRGAGILSILLPLATSLLSSLIK